METSSSPFTIEPSLQIFVAACEKTTMDQNKLILRIAASGQLAVSQRRYCPSLGNPTAN